MLDINNKAWDKLRFSDVIKHLEKIDDDETFFFEYKKDDARNESIVKEVSAFANTYGGYVLLGVEDDKTIAGCSKWTEQKIHNVIYNGITPTPIFDVKKFKSSKGAIFIIKVEESPMPPYITNEGKIFERVSSGSIPIKTSEKLSQLYARHRDNLAKLDNKIGIKELPLHRNFPNNVCAYLDLGFQIHCRNMRKIADGFFKFDVKDVSDFIRSTGLGFSISSLGYSYLITLGKITSDANGQNVVLLDAGLNNYIEIMYDGSVRCRICITADDEEKANVSIIFLCLSLFSEIYKLIFEKTIDRNYIFARKYQKLVVVKQFVPYFKHDALKVLIESLNLFLSEHNKLYGNNLIVSGNRIPPNDFDVLDKSYFEKIGLKFVTENIIIELFRSDYSRLGYIKQRNHE